VLRYANAGHPKPLHIHRQTGTLDFLSPYGERPGPALGVFKEAVYQTRHCTAESHDLILLFTDGLYEVEGENEHYFDQEMLLKTVQQRIQRPADRLIDETLSQVQEFAANHTFADDVCLVGVEVERLAANQNAVSP